MKSISKTFQKSRTPYITFERYEAQLEQSTGDLAFATKDVDNLFAKYGAAALFAALAIEVQKAHKNSLTDNHFGEMPKQEKHEKATIALRDALLRLANSVAAENFDEWGL